MAQDFQIIATNTKPCVGETIKLSHENDSDWSMLTASFDIIGSTTGTDTIVITCIEAGVFNIQANDGTGQGAITITVSETNAGFEAIPGTLEKNKVTFASLAQQAPYGLPYTFDWNFGDSNTETQIIEQNDDNIYRSILNHTYDVSGNDSIFTISLTVTNNYGCSDTYDTTITISKSIFIPNVFTPNNDGKNDNFIIPSPDGTLLSITIFSRWGNIVYESDEPTTVINWNGRLKDNSYVSSGVYYYVLVPENSPNLDKKAGFVHVYTNQNK
jgi:gliding motility-associated-like protein